MDRPGHRRAVRLRQRLCITDDGRSLFMAESDTDRVLRFDVDGEGDLGSGRSICRAGRPATGRAGARPGGQPVRRLLRLGRGLADLPLPGKDTARLGPPRDPREPADEPRVGRLGIRRAVRGEPRRTTVTRTRLAGVRGQKLVHQLGL